MGVFERRRRDVHDEVRDAQDTEQGTGTEDTATEGAALVETTSGPSASPTAPPEPPPIEDDPLIERVTALVTGVEKMFAETLQTGDFVRQIQRTLGDGVEAIRAQTMSDANEALMRAHSSVARARLDAEANGDAALTEVLRRIEAEVTAELEFVDIVPIVPSIGDPIDTKAMRTFGNVPAGVDHATVRKTVERVTACGYQLAHRRILPTVTVRWHTDADPEA
jgi:hypothetical protein